MSLVPNRVFNANIGDISIGQAGPDAIETDIDNLRAWASQHKDPNDTDHDNRYYTKQEVDGKVNLPLAFFKQTNAPAIGGMVGQAKAGDIWFDSSTNRLKYCNGISWVDPMNYS